MVMVLFLCNFICLLSISNRTFIYSSLASFSTNSSPFSSTNLFKASDLSLRSNLALTTFNTLFVYSFKLNLAKTKTKPLYISYTLHIHIKYTGDIMVLARLSLNEYTNKVLNVVKAKFDLKDKSEALNKFVEENGEEFVEKEASDEYIKVLLEIDKRHMKLHKNRTMTIEELDKLCEANNV